MTNIINGDFKNYVDCVFINDAKNCKVCSVYGATKQGKQFVLLKVQKLQYEVYLIMEPDVAEDNRYIHSNIAVPCETFFFQSDADLYIMCKKYELEAERKFICPQFDKYVDQITNSVSGSELYRIRDVDDRGRLFTFVHLKRAFNHCVLLLREPQSDANGDYVNDGRKLSKKKVRNYHLASRYIQKQRNNLKGISDSVEDDDSRIVLDDVVSNEALEAVYDKNAIDAISSEIPFAVNGASSVNSDNNETRHASVTDILRRNTFNAFVEKSIATAFRGEEIYRKYGITKAGQYFAFAVSKIECYIVRVILEPDERYNQWADDVVEYYSRTFILSKINNLLLNDAWVVQNINVLFDKSKDTLNRWNIDCCQFRISKDWKLSPDKILKRGDHIRRYLRVGPLKPTYHDGIYLGNGQVAHYTTSTDTTFFNSKGGSGSGIVSLQKFAKGENDIFIVCYRYPDRSPEEVAKLAEKLVSSQIWDKQYNLFYKNCQNFATLCAIKNYNNIPTTIRWSNVVYRYIPVGAVVAVAIPVAIPKAVPIFVIALPAGTFYLVHKQRKLARKEAQNKLDNVKVHNDSRLGLVDRCYIAVLNNTQALLNRQNFPLLRRVQARRTRFICVSS